MATIVGPPPSVPAVATTAVTVPPQPLPLKDQVRVSFYSTLTTALATVNALTWVEAFKSTLADPDNFLARMFGPSSKRLAPWILAVGVTLLSILVGRALFFLLVPPQTQSADPAGLTS